MVGWGAQKIGLFFPGQGAQFVGMGKEWAGASRKAKGIYDAADQILGFSLSQFCFDGPEETLTRTLYAQPAIFVTSLALFSVLEEKLAGFRPDFAAGLSLGEFSALVAAGSLSFAEGLRLVQGRAQSMEKAAEENRGTMISILGLSEKECLAVAKESGVELANLNAPDQFVLSGRDEAAAKALELAEGMGAKRVIRLKVNGAFHSSLMVPAKERFHEALRKVAILHPTCLFIANASGQRESDPERIRFLLAEQLTSPVRWIETVERARDQGIRRFIELGPGRILKGLAKRIDPSLEVFSFEKLVDLEVIETVLEKAPARKQKSC